VKRFGAPSLQFAVESGAGAGSIYSDAEYLACGAAIENKNEIIKKADVLLAVGCPDEGTISAMQEGTVLVGQLSPLKNEPLMRLLAEKGVEAFSLERLPRISRAQPMDVLSSQSSLAGYQAVILAASKLGRVFPLMMTPTGSIPAVKVLVVGAGIAGLQAIATAKRLGAVVCAFDVRSSAKEEVESLGATFMDVPNTESGEGGGGYAKEMGAEYKKAQEAKLLEVIGRQDVVITTAQIPDKPAPRIITRQMIELMPPNSIVVDLAGENGGNCEGARLGEEVCFGGRRLIAPLRILNEVAQTASDLLAANFMAFVTSLLREEQYNPAVTQVNLADVAEGQARETTTPAKEKKRISFDLDDQLVKSSLIPAVINVVSSRK
jgi:NAD(P) transhydrogenase subunit alpha